MKSRILSQETLDQSRPTRQAWFVKEIFPYLAAVILWLTIMCVFTLRSEALPSWKFIPSIALVVAWVTTRFSRSVNNADGLQSIGLGLYCLIVGFIACKLLPWHLSTTMSVIFSIIWTILIFCLSFITVQNVAARYKKGSSLTTTK